MEAAVRISLPGGGLYWYWQAGVLSYIVEHYDLGSSGCHIEGASAGALSAVLTACATEASPQRESRRRDDESMSGYQGAAPRDGCPLLSAVGRALDIAEENALFDKPFSLAGVWGPLVRQWLEQMLPYDAFHRCAGRVSIQVVRLPWLQPTRIPVGGRKHEDAHEAALSVGSRGDLVDALMASVHIPFFLDGRLWCRYGKLRCIDGTFTFRRCPESQSDPSSSPAHKIEIDRPPEQAMWQTLRAGVTRGQLMQLFHKGYGDASRMRSEGRFDALALKS
ncbi:unnamed protein product [Vitrella brassicaformis CCMP3155]|uniref:PNPLA domain-containing protein n=1 Tax=Vitrella brassicaformis (strain CCMP3155) TaxID=1169540 RepID=A0A0G4GRA0_VITBC|nr:unnamed protein product [Vitrella brassicaformis CCMP3155]|eukprot:CEM32869.1 unnamed protein product [Vitrella brassicaformis CCMP3155]